MYFKFKKCEEEASGLWLLPSFYNHSCLANANRYVLGNLMFVRARENIIKGEEINLMYYNKEEKKNVLEKQWGFTCKCEKCVLNKKIPLNLKKQIDLILNKIRNKNKTGEKRFKEIMSLLNLSQKILEKFRLIFKNDIKKGILENLKFIFQSIALELIYHFNLTDKGIELLLLLESLSFEFTYNYELILDQIYKVYLSIFGKDYYLTKLYYEKLKKHFEIYYGNGSLIEKIKY